MQIMPDSFLNRAENSLGSKLDALPADASFEKEFRRSWENARSSSESGDENPVLAQDTSAPDQDPYLAALMADAPYNPASELLSPFTPQEARFTAEEVKDLVRRLGRDGVSAKALNALTEMGKMPGGPTAAQLIQAARQALEGTRERLTAPEQAQLESLLQKTSGGKGKERAELFSSGTSLNSLDAFLAGLDGQASLTVSRSEMDALAKSLNLSEGASRALRDAFGGKNILTLSGQDMRALLAPARAELATKEADLNTLMGSLEQNLKPVLKDARKREEMERMTALGEDRTVGHTRTLIEDRATQAAPGREDEPDQTRQTRAVSKRVTREESVVADEQKNAGADASRMSEHVQRNTPERETRHQEREAGRDAERHFGQDVRHDQAADNTGRASAPAPAATAPLYATVTQGVGQIQPSSVTPQPSATAGQPLPSALPSQTLEQIDQALLTAFRNGAQRLEVALNPENLGAMTVVLTTRHGEVSALIQPERAETAALITQQVQHIRQELENQGFRVEKVDVQTQLADQQTSQHWQSAEQHNASRDMADRADHLERLRRLSRSSGDGLTTLARDMHISPRTATVAAQGLHIIA